LPVKSEKNIRLEPDTVDGIISQLHQKGYDTGIIDKYILKILGNPMPGRIYIGSKSTNRLVFLYLLTSKRSHYKVITLIPGETAYFFMRQIADKLDLNASKLEKAYRNHSLFKEAGILAESYHIPMHLHENGVIKMMLSLSTKRYRKLSMKYLGRWDPKEWNRILTAASIIQKEAADESEMPLIASVIYNRISRKMRLQMDGTLNYGRYSHTRVTPQRIKTDKSTFNTYKHIGLPSYPVCSVSVAAIKAALNPAKSDYLYFMKNDQGKHDFSTTYKAHLKNIKKRKQELKKQFDQADTKNR